MRYRRRYILPMMVSRVKANTRWLLAKFNRNPIRFIDDATSEISARRKLLTGAGLVALGAAATASPALANTAFTAFPWAATGSSTTRTAPNRALDVINVKDWGAVGDGSTDDSPAIQAAINVLVASGCRGEIYFPPAQIVGGVQKWYQVNTSIDLTWLKTGGGGGLASFVLRGCGEASKLEGTIDDGYIFQRINNTISGYGDEGIMVIEKLSLNNTSSTADSGAIFIASNTTFAVRDCHIGGQNGIILNNAVSHDFTGNVTSSAGAGTNVLTFSGGIPAGSGTTTNYVFDITNPAAIPVDPTTSPQKTKVSSFGATTITLNTNIVSPGVSNNDKIDFGNTALVVFTSTIENCGFQGKGKTTTGGSATGTAISASQGCTIIGCDITGFFVGIRCFLSCQIIGGRLEVNNTGILTDIDTFGYSLAGNSMISIIGPSFESNDTSIDMSAGGNTITIQNVVVKATDGHGIDGIVYKTDSCTVVGMFNTTVVGGFSGYGIRCPFTGGIPGNRTFIGVRVSNTSSESRNWEMPTLAYHGQFINCNNPDPTFTYANLPSGNDAVTGLALNRIGDTYQISDGKTANCADGTCTTFGTAVTGGGGSLKLQVRWNGSQWGLNGI